MIVSIYALLDPRSDRVMYVGATSNPARRRRDYCAGGHSRRLIGWIGELKGSGLLPVFDVMWETTPELAAKEERDAILLFAPPLNAQAPYYAEEGCRLP